MELSPGQMVHAQRWVPQPTCRRPLSTQLIKFMLFWILFFAVDRAAVLLCGVAVVALADRGSCAAIKGQDSNEECRNLDFDTIMFSSLICTGQEANTVLWQMRGCKAALSNHRRHIRRCSMLIKTICKQKTLCQRCLVVQQFVHHQQQAPSRRAAYCTNKVHVRKL